MQVEIVEGGAMPWFELLTIDQLRLVRELLTNAAR
jgi:hypothetical protein